MPRKTKINPQVAKELQALFQDSKVPDPAEFFNAHAQLGAMELAVQIGRVGNISYEDVVEHLATAFDPEGMTPRTFARSAFAFLEQMSVEWDVPIIRIDTESIATPKKSTKLDEKPDKPSEGKKNLKEVKTQLLENYDNDRIRIDCLSILREEFCAESRHGYKKRAFSKMADHWKCQDVGFLQDWQRVEFLKWLKISKEDVEKK